MSTDIPDVTAAYDGGMFDKDAQGWVSRDITVGQTGRDVVVDKGGWVVRGVVGYRYPALGVVCLEMADGRREHFDLEARRLIEGEPREAKRDLCALAATPDGIARLVRATAEAGAVLDARIGAVAASFDPATLAYERTDPRSDGEHARLHIGPEGDAAIILLVLRRPGAAPHRASTRTSAPYPQDFVSLSIDDGRASVWARAPIEVQEAVVAAARRALGDPPALR